MSKNLRLHLKINCSPHHTMSEITKRLFNRNFHSDVQFSVGGKIIYAHSLELIKRSVVFEQQLEQEMSEKKLIPISDCKYESFLEFIRYVYTDECQINKDNCIDILKLASKYKFIKMENEVLNYAVYNTNSLKMFEHVIRNNYEIPRNFIEERLAPDFNQLLLSQQFLALHPDTVDELLKIDRVAANVTELQIFTAVAEWVTSYCKQQNITFAEGRQRCDKIIRNVRFTTLSMEELREGSRKYPGLLSESDQISILRQSVFGDSESQNSLWISQSRKIFISSYELRKYPIKKPIEFNTTFSVSEEKVLRGLRIGVEGSRKPIKIEILETDVKTNTSEKVVFVQNSPVMLGWQLIIGMGDSLRLYPRFKYTIKIQYLDINEDLVVYCRNHSSDVIINDPSKTVNFSQASANMLEIVFAPTAG